MLLRAKCHFPWSIGWMALESSAGPGSSWTTLAGSEPGCRGSRGPPVCPQSPRRGTGYLGGRGRSFPSGPHSHESIHAGGTSVALLTRPAHPACEETPGSERGTDSPETTWPIRADPSWTQDPGSLTPGPGFFSSSCAVAHVLRSQGQMAKPCRQSPDLESGFSLSSCGILDK